MLCGSGGIVEILNFVPVEMTLEARERKEAPPVPVSVGSWCSVIVVVIEEDTTRVPIDQYIEVLERSESFRRSLSIARDPR